MGKYIFKYEPSSKGRFADAVLQLEGDIELGSLMLMFKTYLIAAGYNPEAVARITRLSDEELKTLGYKAENLSIFDDLDY